MVAPSPPQREHRAYRRRKSLEALAPHRMIQGASALGARCWRRAQITHSRGVTQTVIWSLCPGLAARTAGVTEGPVSPARWGPVLTLVIGRREMPECGNDLNKECKRGHSVGNNSHRVVS